MKQLIFKRVSSPYTNHNYIRVNIDEATDIVTFRSYSEFYFYRPITGVDPEIPTDASADPNIEIIYKLIIKHDGHNLSIGDNILISGAIDHLGIPSGIINNEHTITEVKDENTYVITLSKFNLNPTRISSGGGVAVGIYIPNSFRLRFDFSDTIGKILGFRDVSEKTSITTFDITHTNNEKYDFEIEVDQLGEQKTFTNNPIILSGDNYVQMLIKQFQVLSDLGKIKEYFTKILLSDVPGTILFNTFVPAQKIFRNSLKLSELDIEFYSPDGELYNFNNMEHSFTLELITIDEIPELTNISAKTGKIQ